MFYNFLLLIFASSLFVLLGATIGHSILILRIRKEENRKRELELAIYEKRSQVIKEGKKISGELEELLYKANVQLEIDKIKKKNDTLFFIFRKN